MKNSIFVCAIYLLIYTIHYHIRETYPTKLKHNLQWNETDIYYIKNISTGLSFVFLLVSGILGAFVVSAKILVATSIVSVFISILCFDLSFNGYSSVSHNLKDFFESPNISFQSINDLQYESQLPGVVFGILFLAIYFGTFRSIIPVIILDQIKSEDDTEKLNKIISIYLLTLNIGGLIGVVITVVEGNEITMMYTKIDLSLLFIVILLLIIGYKMKIIPIQSPVLDPRRLFFAPPQSAEKVTQHEFLISVATNVIMFFVLIPYGFIDSQYRFTFPLQARQMEWPPIKVYSDAVQNAWTECFSAVFVISSLLIIFLLLRYSKKFKSMYSNTIMRIAFGFTFSFLSILVSGLVEYFRRNKFWQWDNNATSVNNPKIQTFDGDNYTASPLSVFALTPQVALSSLSEVIVVTTSIEFMYRNSRDSFKYLSMALNIAAVSSGGIGDLLNIMVKDLVDKSLVFLNDLNHRKAKKNGSCCEEESRLDKLLWIFSGCAFVSVIMTFCLMYAFRHRIKNKIAPDDASMISNMTTQ